MRSDILHKATDLEALAIDSEVSGGQPVTVCCVTLAQNASYCFLLEAITINQGCETKTKTEK